MERISMLGIDKEVEDLKERIKDLLKIDIGISRELDTLRNQNWIIHKDLEEISACKDTTAFRFCLQSKLYNLVVYVIDCNYEKQGSVFSIKLKPGEPVIFVSDEKYGLSISKLGFIYAHIQWRKRSNTSTKTQPIYGIKYELPIGSDLSTEEQSIKSVLNPSKTQQGYIKEISIYLE